MAKYENIREAARRGTVENVKYFIEKFGDSPKEAIADAVWSNGNVAVLEYLISQCDGTNHDWNWMLEGAASNNESDAVVEYLIAQGADVNAKHKYGATPLDFALEKARYHAFRAKECQKTIKNHHALGQPERYRDLFLSATKELEESERIVPLAEKKANFLRDKGAVTGTGDITGRGKAPNYKSSGCLVMFAALGALLTSGFCCLALFAAAALGF